MLHGPKSPSRPPSRPNRPLGKQSETLASPNTDTWPQTEKGGGKVGGFMKTRPKRLLDKQSETLASPYTDT